VSETFQGVFSYLGRDSSTNIGEWGVLMVNQAIPESQAVTQKLEAIEGTQAIERDQLASMNKTLDAKIGSLGLIKTLLAQSQMKSVGHENAKGNKSQPISVEPENSTTQGFGGKGLEKERCYWCGITGHFLADCDDLKEQLRSGYVKSNSEGKLRLKDGSFIPNQPSGATLKEKVERHYARKPSQFFYGEYEDSDPPVSLVPRYAQYMGSTGETERKLARLEAELELRKREEALESRRKKLELEEKKLDSVSVGPRTVNTVDILGTLTEDEIAAIKAARAGFP
jgi:hypothetical protein